MDFTSAPGANGPTQRTIITIITETLLCRLNMVQLFKGLWFFLGFFVFHFVWWKFSLQLSHFWNSDTNDSINPEKKPPEETLPPTQVNSPLLHLEKKKNARRSRLLLFSARLFLDVYAPLVNCLLLAVEESTSIYKRINVYVLYLSHFRSCEYPAGWGEYFLTRSLHHGTRK